MPESIRRTVRVATALAAAGAALALPAAAPASAPEPASLPSCAEGPEVVGDVVVGTPCDDRIVAPATVTAVDGGPGDDVIIGANSAAVPAQSGDPSYGLHLEVGSQTFNGGAGNDVVYGDRGNDILRGNAGNDRLYGGIGDDVLEGGEGDDVLSGGFGGDKIDGQSGNDYVRGDGTIDRIFDTGGGFDTLSFATGVTPGFGAGIGKTISETVANFPKDAEGERGVDLELGVGGKNANDGIAAAGGGVDEVQIGVFERILGTPFSDYIVGTPASEEIWGGGGADVIKGGGGADALHGGGEGDFLEATAEASIDGEGGKDNCVGTAAKLNCEGSTSAVENRKTGLVSVGETTAVPGLTQVYLVGGSGSDGVSVSYAGGGNVEISLSGGTFDTSLVESGRCAIAATSASCPVAGLLDAVLLAGMGGNDTVSANVPDGVGVVELGGTGSDNLTGSASEDALVDGEGAVADTLSGRGGDDALVHDFGPDLLDGGQGSDLFFSASLCEGEAIVGGEERVGAPVPDRDNASWAKLGEVGVDARLDQSRVGLIGDGEQSQCPANRFDTLSGIEDLEGSEQSDVLYGDDGPNQLLGHKGSDSFFALGNSDLILANSGTVDRVINCGLGVDQAVIDLVSKAIDPAPIECERVREGAPEEFDELPLLSEPPPPPPAPLPPPDRTPPKTEILRHPPKTLRVRAGKRKLVAFRFAATEVGSSFHCKLDRKPYARCRSPRKYRVAVGRHVFRLFATDAAGNRDRSPAVFQFRVAAVKRHQAKR